MASSTQPHDHHLHHESPEPFPDLDWQDSNRIEHNSVDEKPLPPSLDTLNTLQHQEAAGIEMSAISPSFQRADASRHIDDLELLRAEEFISNQEHEATRTASKNRAHNIEPEDAFNPTVTKEEHVKKRNEDATLYKFWLFLKKFPRFVRYLVYLFPGAALLLIPVLLGAFRYNDGSNLVGGDGGVELMWFGIWLEIVWASLWVSRMLTSLLPHIFHGIATILGSTTTKKWRDIGAQLELHTALFLWFLAILISFKPTVDGHQVGAPDKDKSGNDWVDIVNKVIVSLFVLFTLNFVEKILIQWIATSFHQRTYSTRIENNKGDIRQLVQLFEFAKAKLEDTDKFWQGHDGNSNASGAQTPMANFHEGARQVLGKVGHVAGRVGNDLIGRKVNVNQPRKVVSELLRTTSSAHTLARLIYRSVVREDRDTVYPEDLKQVFATQEEIDAAFGVFDKDLNGDISIDEFEAVCNEIRLEKKAIAASLKDLDSVIQKLDKVFLFIIIVVTVIVFVSIFSSSTAAGLASASTSILGLAWVLQATAQEFLQSIIFVFVKHPFDVGDRVTIYGSTGANMTGDDYYVTEISLLYTEFKKLQGHIVQAPNSVLNTLFILNQRRSNGLSDVIPLQFKFGTPAWMIDELKARMLNFCLANKRDYQPTIITEMTGVDQIRSANMNMVFIHKSNFQNELLRLNRHNKFVTELLYQLEQVGIQGPLRVDPGGSREYPMYYAGAHPPPYSNGKEQHDASTGFAPGPAPSRAAMPRHNSVRSTHLSTRNEEAIMDFQDVFENRRDQSLARRMESIREKDIAERAEAESEPRPSRASTTGAVLTPSQSVTSQARSRFFSRHRSGTKGHHHQPPQSDIV
ncbi:Mechanosensitive ion channel family protein [Metarhizium rileyi]|uniref:Mechanosensitive ion channel protein n=1 Tax=Metarhizium rileyi (strain RCEF 4871) TaxID=1649241 RepID=A0A162JGF9_METRR|nr:Mechanosensitive ion channel family protein [Metarhizium rileyi RCEF 4871]